MRTVTQPFWKFNLVIVFLFYMFFLGGGSFVCLLVLFQKNLWRKWWAHSKPQRGSSTKMLPSIYILGFCLFVCFFNAFLTCMLSNFYTFPFHSPVSFFLCTQTKGVAMSELMCPVRMAPCWCFLFAPQDWFLFKHSFLLCFFVCLFCVLLFQSIFPFRLCFVSPACQTSEC